MMTTLVIAMLLHGGFVLWFSLPDPVSPPEPVPPPLRINLLASVAESNVNAATEIIQPPAPVPEKTVPEKPVPEKLVPEKSVSEKSAPVIKKPLLREPEKPKPVEPPESEVKPLADVPEPVTETVQPAVPAETSSAPLDAIATARYEQLLVAWLEQHKKYPRRAKRLRIEGEAVLRIVIDRFGQTQQVSLVQRSGNRLLDRAALEMVKRANPFPPMPENDSRAQLEFVVPVAFLLR